MLLLLFLLLLPAITAALPATLHLLSDANATHGALCLDGSPPGVYIRDTLPGAPWIIAQAGGGWCFNESDCYARSLTPLGSSLTWAPTQEGSGLESDDCTANPTFCAFNVALLPYCDGMSQLSSRSDPILYTNASTGATTELWARGLNILAAVLDHLLAATSLPLATAVLLDGCSAGGHSAYHHLDRVGALLPGADVRAVGDAGFFLDSQIATGSRYSYSPGQFYYRSLLSYYFAMHNASAGVAAACLASKPPAAAWQCATSLEALRWSTRPAFALQSDYDSYQMGNHFAPPWLPGVDPAWAACTGNASACWPEQVDYLQAAWVGPFRGALAVAGVLGPRLTPHGPHGLFLHSCQTHCQVGSAHAIAIGGTSMYQALSAWWARDRGPGADYAWVDCLGPACNPTCSAA
jgi:hypothetical protein